MRQPCGRGSGSSGRAERTGEDTARCSFSTRAWTGRRRGRRRRPSRSSTPAPVRKRNASSPAATMPTTTMRKTAPTPTRSSYPRAPRTNGGRALAAQTRHRGAAARVSRAATTLERRRHGEGPRPERQERQAVRGPAQEGHEQVARRSDRELAGRLEPRRQEQRLGGQRQEQRLGKRRQPRAEGGGGAQGRQEVLVAAAAAPAARSVQDV